MVRQSSDIMVDRNIKAKNLEKKGQIQHAIELYEANVSAGYTGYEPYNRLRVIYTDQQPYADAIRVCKAYLDVANSILNSGSPHTDVLTRRARFLNYIQRLELAKNTKISTK